MIREFDVKEFEISNSGTIMWHNGDCPFCKEYNSSSFLFDIVPGQDTYIGSCVHCKKEITYHIEKKLLDEIILAQKEYRQYLREVYDKDYAKQKLLFKRNVAVILVRRFIPRSWEESKVHCFVGHNFKDQSGSSPCLTDEDVEKQIEHYKKRYAEEKVSTVVWDRRDNDKFQSVL